MSAVISQKGNAYLEGFSDQWGPWQAYWREPTAANRQACRASLSPQTIRDRQYGTGAHPHTLSPDGYTLDIAYIRRHWRICKGTADAATGLRAHTDVGLHERAKLPK